MIAAITMNYVEEAIGIARAARAAKMPTAISFTVETDGRLPAGETIENAIKEVDAAADAAPAYYNQLRASHALPGRAGNGETLARADQGYQGERVHKGHAELDEAQELDAGNPCELATEYRDLVNRIPTLNVLGGCCRTDHRHIEEICKILRT